MTETFTISDALFGKLKNLFKNMHVLWLQYFFRDIVERGMIAKQQMPVIDNEDDGDPVGKAFDELEPIESFEDVTIGEGVDSYEYDEPAVAESEA
jgi:hypothetical protein